MCLIRDRFVCLAWYVSVCVNRWVSVCGWYGVCVVYVGVGIWVFICVKCAYFCLCGGICTCV